MEELTDAALVEEIDSMDVEMFDIEFQTAGNYVAHGNLNKGRVLCELIRSRVSTLKQSMWQPVTRGLGSPDPPRSRDGQLSKLIWTENIGNLCTKLLSGVDVDFERLNYASIDPSAAAVLQKTRFEDLPTWETLDSRTITAPMDETSFEKPDG